MSSEVLQTSKQIAVARKRLRNRGLSCLTPLWQRAALRLHLTSGVRIGDYRKSWDVLKTVEFVERHLAKDEAILDIGAYGSEIPCILRKLGFSRVAGIDLNPTLKRMPHSDAIDYVVSDFTATPFADATFSAITAISVIEHGFNSKRLLMEIARLLKPGGYFIASVDYWDKKVDTRGVKLFGLDWIIFSAQEIEALASETAVYGLAPCGSLRLGTTDSPITYLGRKYTFAWFGLQKGRGETTPANSPVRGGSAVNGSGV